MVCLTLCWLFPSWHSPWSVPVCRGSSLAAVCWSCGFTVLWGYWEAQTECSRSLCHKVFVLLCLLLLPCAQRQSSQQSTATAEAIPFLTLVCLSVFPKEVLSRHADRFPEARKQETVGRFGGGSSSRVAGSLRVSLLSSPKGSQAAQNSRKRCWKQGQAVGWLETLGSL